ncbi:MAG: toll/interleukin-1 receptor domain-containing protein, partial [Pseudomonadota bacterium]
MADIFLSYSRADRPKAQQIAESLEAEGFSVWWDKVLRAGQTYDEVTEGMLRDSRVVVVLWSEVSVKS